MKGTGMETRRSFWTPERDAKLRTLWATTMSLAEMVSAFGGAVSGPYISKHASDMGLPARTATTLAQREGRAQRATHYAVAAPNDFKGQNPVAFAATPARRVAAHAEATPCPFIDPAAPLDPATGEIRRCDVMVDRRPRRDGSRPSQYCAAHAPRVTPISCGGGNGSRAGIRIVDTFSRGVRG